MDAASEHPIPDESFEDCSSGRGLREMGFEQEARECAFRYMYCRWPWPVVRLCTRSIVEAGTRP